jgi:hypothetical protein
MMWKSVGLRLLILTVMVGCGASDLTIPARRNIVPPPPLPADPRPLCEDKLKETDTDADGIKDFDEILGTSVQGKIYRSDPFEADTDFDGRKDGEEIANQKIQGEGSVYENNLLRRVTPTNPHLRDFIVLVFARGGQDGSPHLTIPNGGMSGWNGWGGLNGSDADSRQKIVKRPQEERVLVKTLALASENQADLVARIDNDFPQGVPNDWLPNICKINSNLKACACWQGNNSNDCVQSEGLGTNYQGDDRFQQCSTNNGSHYTCAKPNGNLRTIRDSLIGRYNLDGLSSGSTGLMSVIEGVEAFRIGSAGPNNLPQPPTDGARYQVTPLSASEWVLPTPENGEHILLRHHNDNSQPNLDNNSGFILVQITFEDSSLLNTYKTPTTDAEKDALKQTYYSDSRYAVICRAN